MINKKIVRINSTRRFIFNDSAPCPLESVRWCVNMSVYEEGMQNRFLVGCFAKQVDAHHYGSRRENRRLVLYIYTFMGKVEKERRKKTAAERKE